MKTPFEQAQEDVKAGKLEEPSVSYGSKGVDCFTYQLAVHRFNLQIMSGGMTCRGVKFTDIKKYYGLKGRSAKDCLPQFEAIMKAYEEKRLMGVSVN